MHKMHGEYLNLERIKGGLNVRLTDEGRTDMEYQTEQHPDWTDLDHFSHLFEDFAGNGWMLIDAEAIGAMTGCQLIISPDATVDDEGDVQVGDEIYWHAAYAVEDFAERLRVNRAFLKDGSNEPSP